jgi:hypothetical protein
MGMSSFELSVRAELTDCPLIPVRADSSGLTKLKKETNSDLRSLQQKKAIRQNLQANRGRMFAAIGKVFGLSLALK